MSDYTRPAILAALDSAISIGVLASTGFVPFHVALLALLGGLVSMGVGEYVSVENGQQDVSPWKAVVGSSAGFLAGGLAPVLLCLTASPWLIVTGSLLSVLALSLAVTHLNGLRYGARAAILGSAALALSFLIGV